MLVRPDGHIIATVPDDGAASRDAIAAVLRKWAVAETADSAQKAMP
jgi:hypothetical protein